MELNEITEEASEETTVEQETPRKKLDKRRNPFRIQNEKEEKERRQKKRARLIVRNISYKIKEDDLRKHFETWGKLEDVNLLKRSDGKLVGCAFVQYENVNQATKAILKGNGKELLGRPIYIDWAVGKDEFEAKKSGVKDEPDEKKPKLEIKTEELHINDADEIDKDDIKSDEEEFQDEECEDYEPSNNDLLVSTSSDDIKKKLLSGVYKLIPRTGRSKVWDFFATIQDNDGVEIDYKVGCKCCFSVLKYDLKSTSNLLKHKCYVINKENALPKVQVNNNFRKEALRVLSKWCIENCRPFRIAEDSGLKQFSEIMIHIGAKYGTNIDMEIVLPHVASISQNISNKYQIAFDKVKDEVAVGCKHGYGLTSDIWTDSYLQQSYIALTMHFIVDGQLVSRLLGLNSLDAVQLTNVVVRTKTQKLLNDFNCRLEDAIMVTNRGSNLVNAFNRFDHISCINHLLNDVVEKSIQQVDEVAEMYSQCSNVAKYLKKIGQNSILGTSLGTVSPTRWNTVYYLFDAIEINWLKIEDVLEQKNELQKVEHINMELIKSVINLLKPFEEASKKLEEEEYATLHLVFAYINGLTNACGVSENEDIDVIKKFKQTLNDNIQSIVIRNLSVIHKIALFLFPPANKLIHFGEDERVAVKAECAKRLKSYWQNTNDEDTETSTLPQCTSLISSYFTKSATQTRASNPDDKITDEINAYENMNVSFEDNFDVIQWWHLRQSQFPLLHKFSCKILATPATSASSERVFSRGRNVLCENGRNITPNCDTFNQIMFLHFNV